MPSLIAPCSELCLRFTLPSGQCFRWRKRKERNSHQLDVWVGVIGQRVVSLAQDESAGLLHYDFLNPAAGDPKSISEEAGGGDDVSGEKKSKRGVKRLKKGCPPDEEAEDVIREYFQLKTPLTPLYCEWNERDALFRSIAHKFPGVRVLRQDPVENLFSFICSSCNNIKRISAMVDNMCMRFGKFLMRDQEFGDLHSFPTIDSLTDPTVESVLRNMGFGYRAAFIHKAANMLSQEKICLKDYRTGEYEEVRKSLIRIPGIGRKVADCICLFSLDKPCAIPVDTHVYQIAARHYLTDLPLNKKANVSEKVYKEISGKLQSVFGGYAGWAHSVLFTADLTAFKDKKSNK